MAPPSRHSPRKRGAHARSAVAAVTEAGDCVSQGLPVAIRGKDGTSLIYALETLVADSLADVMGGVLLSDTCASPHAEDSTVHAEVVALPIDAGRNAGTAAGDRRSDFRSRRTDERPVYAVARGSPEAFAASVKLAKLSGLLGPQRSCVIETTSPDAFGDFR